eukprot:193926_1
MNTKHMKNIEIKINCDGRNIVNCVALKHLISLLKFYSKHHCNSHEINEYFQKCEYECPSYFINIYHHILDLHLNEDKIFKTQTNQQFETIYKVISENNLLCNIEECTIFARNNREREKDTISIQGKDECLSFFINFMDTIHCYFIHSVDTGYRIMTNDSQTSYKKAKKIAKRRLIHNKFMTYFGTQATQATQPKQLQNDDNVDESKQTVE